MRLINSNLNWKVTRRRARHKIARQRRITMSTERGPQKKSQFALRDNEDQVRMSLDLNKTQPQHIQSQTFLDNSQQQKLEIQHCIIGSDGEEIKSPTRGVNTNNSNESVPIRSAQDNSQQSYNYEFLYDAEMAAKRGSSVSYKQSDGAASSSAAGQSATSPHVFMLSTDEYRNGGRSATTSVPGGMEGGRSSLLSRGSHGQLSRLGSETTQGPPPQMANDIVSRYVDQRDDNNNLTEGQEEQYIEEEYYIEEEVEESIEEEQSVQTRGVETIKEVSSDQENASPGDSQDPRSADQEPLGTIMQTASISPGRQRHVESVEFTHSQKGITASDFKDFNKCNSSSKMTDSNMASLVFKPKDSDQATYTQLQSMSVHSNHSKQSSKKKTQPRPMSEQLMSKQGSHPSFGMSAGQSFNNPKHSRSGSRDANATIPSKWANVAEKCAMRMVTKDIYASLSKISDVFQRRLIQQELILTNQSHMQLKSFLEISMNSSQSASLLQMSPREQQTIYNELRDKSLVQMHRDLSFKLERVAGNLVDYFKGESDILQSMAQERERNLFLEAELSAREDRIRQWQSPQAPDESGRGELDEQDLQATEQFISELEAQLQNARADLLSAKLTISDQNVEIENLKMKNEAVQAQVNQFLEERRNFEESFENLRQQLGALQSEKLELSQMVRDRESTLVPNQLQGFAGNYSSNQDYSTRNYAQMQVQHSSSQFNQSGELKKQIDSLNRQVFEATKRQESLQVVENTLLDKLDKKELENMELKEGLFELKQENNMKGEVISKAQKIIERLTQKSESDDKVLKRINGEKEDQKRDLLEKNKSISQLTEQLNEVKNRQSHDKNRMEETMSRELEEVRNAVREYQIELGTEKQNYAQRLSQLQSEIHKLGLENQNQRETAEAEEEQARAELENSRQLINDLSLKLKTQEEANSELREQMQQEVGLVEETSKNQIKYLQTRIKEIVEETQNKSSLGTTVDGSPDPKNQTGHSSKRSTGKLPLMSAIKKELESMSQEVLSIRDTLRVEGNRRDALVNQKMTKFEEFKLSVLDQLVLWDEKTAELAGLAEKYTGALEEQKRLFLKLKLVVQEKDQVITELHRSLAMREHSSQHQFDSLKNELEQSNQLMTEELLGTISLLEQKVLLKEKELLEAEKDKISFRREFTKVLEERNYFERKLGETGERLNCKETELERMHLTMRERESKYGEILNIRSMTLSENTLEHAMKNAVDDARRYSQEMISYRDKFNQLEKDRDEERLLLNQKVTSLEEQYSLLQKEAIDKEEEQQLEFAARESELLRDSDQAKAYADKIEAELQTRERQLKKIQDKIDEDDKRLEDAQAKIEIVAEEKMEALGHARDFEHANEKLVEHVEHLEEKLREQEDVTLNVRRDVQKEQRNVSEKIAAILELEGHLKQRDKEVAALQGSQSELDAKIKNVEARSAQTSKDLTEVYQELSQAKAAKAETDKARDGLSLEIQSLTSLIKKRQAELEKKEQEVQQYQKTVMRQTRELDSAHKQSKLIEAQKQRLKSFDETMQEQSHVIEKLKVELRGPDTRSNGTQTIDSGMLELEYARQEVLKSQQCQEVVYQENMQLKEALQRSSYEVCRLIEDKRELEDLIEKLNKSIGFFRQNQSKAPMSSKGYNDSMTAMSAAGNGDEVIGRVLAEKENYISGLENEISEMRKEIEIQRDQLLQAEAQTIDVKANQSLMSASGRNPNQNSGFSGQPYQPSSPQYLYNAGLQNFIQQSRDVAQKSKRQNQNQNTLNSIGGSGILRSTSRDRQAQMSNEQLPQVPMKLQATTMNYSTLSRSLTPVDQITTSDSKAKQSGYFNNANNSSMAMTNNQTQASAMLNNTHYNSQTGGTFLGANTSASGIAGRPHDNNASYLNVNNTSSVLMNYQTAGVNQSVMTNERSLGWVDQQQLQNAQHFQQHRGGNASLQNIVPYGNNTSSAQISGMAQSSPADKENSYGAPYVVHA